MAAKPRKKLDFVKLAALAVVEIWQNILWILFLCGVALFFYAWHSAMAKNEFAQATLILRYEEAYEGLNPNGTRFNINELMSDEVLSRAIQLAGLTGTLDEEELLDCLVVKASGSQSPKNAYIATEYSIRLLGDCLPDHISPDNMLTLLMETYKQYFLSHYGSNDSALDIQWEDVGDWEYLEFADIMKVKVNNLITYLEDLRSESGMYQYHTQGESFRSLSESVSNFRDIYLNKYTSYVSMNHLFRNPSAYRSKLTYRRFLTNQSLVGNEDRYEIYQDALKMYDESMITFVMVPLYDVENGLYMARTSVGMDDLTSNSQSYAEKIEINAKEIKVFDQSLQNTYSADLSKSKYDYADAMIQEIQTHLDSIIVRIQLVVKEYEEYRCKNSILFAVEKYGLISGYGLKRSFIVAMGVGFLLCVFYGYRAVRRETGS